ncbi:F0F1 ATP synthase subunit A [Mycoplasmopsis gallopavonis]|nr:F0F1 ATP synthase subunit A [Mycoplasmopsis gallopavonis]
MDEILRHFSDWNQPQLLSLVVTVILIFAMSLTAFIKIKQVKPNEAPKGAAYLAEAYIGMIENQFTETVGERKLQRAKVYILSLGTFLLIGNAVAIFGLDPIVTSYSVPFTLAFASWIGIFATGMIYRKWRYLKAFMNPLDLIGKISPLISLSFRIYGNVIGGTAVIFLIYSMLAGFGNALPGAQGSSGFVFLAPIIAPPLHFYFDIFGSTLQAYIFTLLTTIYWLVESEEEEPKPKKKKRIQILKTKVSKLQNETVY